MHILTENLALNTRIKALHTKVDTHTHHSMELALHATTSRHIEPLANPLQKTPGHTWNDESLL